MPNYDYKCLKCQHIFEVFNKIDNRLKTTSEPCPSCNESGEIELLVGCSGSVAIIDPMRLAGRMKPTTEFRERIKNMKKEIPGATLPDY